jgi:hypothetical protein
MEQYEQGATSFTTVLTAEQNLLRAQSSVAGALANVPQGLTAVFRAPGGGWQIRVDGNFVTAGTLEQMGARTNWGSLLPPSDEPQPPAPDLPGPEDIGPTVRPPEWSLRELSLLSLRSQGYRSGTDCRIRNARTHQCARRCHSLSGDDLNSGGNEPRLAAGNVRKCEGICRQRWRYRSPRLLVWISADTACL